MSNYIVIPDSFKGTLSGNEICDIMQKAILEIEPNANVVKIPLADGGEGTVDYFINSCKGEKKFVSTVDCFNKPINAFYGLIDGGQTAVMEVACVVGLPLTENRKNPLIATTVGIARLVENAVHNGAKKIIFGLGGTATNDCGAGLCAGLGAKFLNKSGQTFIPTGATLSEVTDANLSRFTDQYGKVEFVAMCDVNNPLYGQNGCAYVYAKQKGADEKTVQILEQNSINFANLIENKSTQKYSQLQGSGAAGGMGFGVTAIMGGRLQSGINTLLDAVEFDNKVESADFVSQAREDLTARRCAERP